MATCRGMLILLVPLFVCSSNILTWVGGSFTPRPIVHRPSNPAVQRFATSKQTKVAIGDTVYYAWPRQYPIEGNMRAHFGDRAVVINIYPEDQSLKVMWQGSNDGHIGYILGEAMKKEMKADTVFLQMDANRDGILRKQEVGHLFPNEFKMLDQDGDDMLDRGEWDFGAMKLPAEFYMKLGDKLKNLEFGRGSAIF